MKRRTVNLMDAGRQDIIDICSAMEQIFLSYEKDDIPYIYIINLLELLLQSARTRVCILRFPRQVHKKHYTIEEVKTDCVVFANFRDRRLYHRFCEKLTKILNKKPSLAHFFAYELEKIPAAKEDLYFCLPRISIRDRKVKLDHAFNKESYYRIRQLLQTMYMEKGYWGIDLLSELYHCLDRIPATTNLNCNSSCAAQPIVHTPDAAKKLPIDNNAQPETNFLEPIYEWTEYIYEHAWKSRMVQVAHHNDSQNIVHYRNLFFFLRENKVADHPETRNCDNFDVKMICPPQQREELTRYFHEHQKDGCQWYQQGECQISGMPHCEIDSLWDEMPIASKSWTKDKNEIMAHYAPLWDTLGEAVGSSIETSESAFRSNSVIFERYAEHQTQTSGYVRIDPDVKRDRVMACVRYRLLAPATDGGDSEEDLVPQVMFVPIYTGASPFMLAATVINAKIPPPLSETMTEWRMAYRFSEMVLQFMSSRLKEAARKAYLNTAADIMEDFAYEEIKLQLDDSRTIEEHREALNKTNYQLAALAVKYPYQQITLEFNQKLVNDNDGRCVEIGDFTYNVRIGDNSYWCHYSARNYFSADVVVRKFRSALARSIQRRHDERRREILEALSKNFPPLPPSKTIH